MNTNFAQRAKDIVAKHGSDKKSMLLELDALRREQFEHEKQFANGGNITVNKELKNGVKVEMEHADTLKDIIAYHKSKGQYPSTKEVAKDIALDHMEDFKEDPNGIDESYYKGLIERGLTDETKRYKESGGSIHPLDVSTDKLKSMRIMESGGDILKSGFGYGYNGLPYNPVTTYTANKSGMDPKFATQYEQGSKIAMGGNVSQGIHFNPMLNQVVQNRFGDGGGLTPNPLFGWRGLGMKYKHKANESAYTNPLAKENGGDISMQGADGDNYRMTGGPIVPGQLFNTGSTQYDGGGPYSSTPSRSSMSNSPYIKPNPVTPGNYFNAQDAINKGQSSVVDLMESKYPQGTPLGTKDVPMQHKTGNFYGGVNSDIVRAANPELVRSLGLPDTGEFTPEQIAKLGSVIRSTPELAAKMLNPKDEKFGADHVRGMQVSSPAVPTPRGPGITPMIPSYQRPKDAPGLMKSTPYVEQPTYGDKRDWSNALRMAPVAANLIAGLTAKKGKGLPTNVSLPTIAPTLIAPQQLSTAPIENAATRQYNNALNAMTGAAGGSGAAMRSGISSIANNEATSNTIADIYSKNAMLRGDADKYNASATQDVNKINLDQANRAQQMSRENVIANQQDLAARDMNRRNSLVGAMTQLGEIGKENKQVDTLKRMYKYDQWGNRIDWEDKPKSKKNIGLLAKARSYIADKYVKNNPAVYKPSTTTNRPSQVSKPWE